MRCLCCNRALTTKESVRRFSVSKEFCDMCDTCLETISDDVNTIDGKAGDGDYDEEDE